MRPTLGFSEIQTREPELQKKTEFANIGITVSPELGTFLARRYRLQNLDQSEIRLQASGQERTYEILIETLPKDLEIDESQ